MKIDKTVAYIAGGLIVVSLIGIGSYLYKQITLLKSSCYAISGVIIKSLSLQRCQFTLLLKVYNRSDIPLTLSNQVYKIYVQDMLVSIAKILPAVEIPSKVSKTINLDVDFAPTDLVKVGWQNLTSLIKDKSKLKIRTLGTLSIKSGIININNAQIETVYTLEELTKPSPKPAEATSGGGTAGAGAQRVSKNSDDFCKSFK